MNALMARSNMKMLRGVGMVIKERVERGIVDEVVLSMREGLYIKGEMVVWRWGG
nr:hypothetical protein [Bacillus sp. WP8]